MLLLFLCVHVYAQSDTMPRHGTIRVGKKISDSVFITAHVDWRYFSGKKLKKEKAYQDYSIAVSKMAEEKTGSLYEPSPLMKEYKLPFDYALFFNEHIPSKIKLDGDGVDTVRIRIDVSMDGRFFYKDQSKMTRIGQEIVLFDPASNVYFVSETHRSVMEVLRLIGSWKPAQKMTTKQQKFKGQTVIVPAFSDLYATGYLTVVFSSTPFPR